MRDAQRARVRRAAPDAEHAAARLARRRGGGSGAETRRVGRGAGGGSGEADGRPFEVSVVSLPRLGSVLDVEHDRAARPDAPGCARRRVHPASERGAKASASERGTREPRPTRSVAYLEVGEQRRDLEEQEEVADVVEERAQREEVDERARDVVRERDVGAAVEHRYDRRPDEVARRDREVELPRERSPVRGRPSRPPTEERTTTREGVPRSAHRTAAGDARPSGDRRSSGLGSRGGWHVLRS